ncbi:MAG: hypothetical protein NXI31_21580 [bacterium]|nr:hypothetical protein [bacterium]
MRHLFASLLSLAVLTQLPAQVEWWTQDFDSALAAAGEAEGKMVMLYFWRADHGGCSSMFGGTLGDEKAVPVISRYVCMGAQAETEIGTPLFAKYHIQQVPTVVFVQPDGAVVDLVEGYVAVADFLAEVERIEKGDDTIAGLRAKIAAAPDDFQSGADLVNKLNSIGDAEGAAKVIDAMIARDPKGRNPFVAEMMLAKIIAEVRKPGVSSLDYDVAPLRKFLAKQRNKRVKFLGYDQMARIEYSRDNLKAAAKHCEAAWKSIPKDRVLDWGQRMASIAYNKHKELAKIDKGILKQALKISKKALDAAEAAFKKTPDKAWMANALVRHAAVLIVNNKRKEAFAVVDRAIELDPKTEDHKEWKKRWVSGAK